MKWLLALMTAAGIAALDVSLVAGAEPSPSGKPPQQTPRPSIPEAFLPVDTSRLMTPPDPLPLESVRVFPQLSFERPVELTYADDGTDRLFVVEQRGTIRVFENRVDASQAKLFLDIRDVVLREGNEEGLLGLAFHPKFRQNGEFFVYYSTRPRAKARASVVSRFRVSTDNPDRADRGSEEQVLRVEQPYPNHNGGSIRFGPDGHLYIGLGDGGLADDPHVNGQNLRTLLGSILRIDVDRRDEGLAYAIPRDNPFAGRDDARGEIWAYGFRNVWRLSFDRRTGELWAGDVGQNRFEEVNRVQRGGNYGWNIREGFHPFEPNSPAKPAGLIDPVAEYFRHEGQSVTGGLVYRGPTLKAYLGAYFYADFVSGNVWAVRVGGEPDDRRNGEDAVENRIVARTGLEVAAFGEDQHGEMYLCAFDGYIYQMRPWAIDGEAAGRFPRRLSETGLFASVKDNIPAAGLIPYELNMPFWSDFAVKDRYIALPRKQSVRFHGRDKWEFPAGTVFVKTFWMHRDRARLRRPVRLETRLLVHSPEGWAGYTYVYNDEQTEAELLDGSLLRPIEVETADGTISQPYYFPSRSDCLACHTKAEGFVLGPTTRQMNHRLDYHGRSENQIEMLDRLGVFTGSASAAPERLEKFPDWRFGNLDRSPDDGRQESVLDLPDAKTPELARAWLEVNCATCHRPEGIAPGERDMRFHTPLAGMKLVGERPQQGHLSPPGGRILKPGDPGRSELFLRAAHRSSRQMPPLATNVVDPRGLEALRRWIEGLSETE
jgi:uncharacterized repeat protein (TIGR03806 family)